MASSEPSMIPTESTYAWRGIGRASRHSLLEALPVLLFLVLCSYVIVWIVYTRFFHPLRNVPGPFLASVTRFWSVWQVIRGDFEVTQRRLHAQHGPLIRLAPDEVGCSDAAAIKSIYGIQNVFTKTHFYVPWGPPPHKFKYRGHFSEMNEKMHSQRRRIVNPVYTMSSVLESEQYVDKCSALFIERMLDKAKTGESVDLGRWVQMYTFDVLGELFFGSMFGFLATGTDINSYIEALDNILPVMATAGACPKMVQKYVFPLAMLLPSTRRALPSLQHIEKSSQQRVEERHLHMKEGKPLRRDMLAKLFEIARDKGDEKDFHHADIQIECHTALAAGSDTTAIALRAIFYYLMKAPTTYTRLLQEVDTATSNGDLSDPVKYSEAIKMPYLCAVIKEAMRLHPSVGLTLPRYVPTGGVQLAGHFIPAGYQVGINGAVVQYDRNVFGADAEAFNPDRWLERDAAMMEKHMMTFGSGTRTCIGKNISLSEIHKFVPQFLRACNIELTEPERPWTTHNYWFNTQRGVNVKVTRRASTST